MVGKCILQHCVLYWRLRLFYATRLLTAGDMTMQKHRIIVDGH